MNSLGCQEPSPVVCCCPQVGLSKSLSAQRAQKKKERKDGIVLSEVWE